MKKTNRVISTFLLIFCNFSEGAALEPLDSLAQQKLDSLNYRRNMTVDFYQKLVFFSEPSLLSPIYFDYNTGNKKPYVLHADVKIPIGLGGPRWSTKKRDDSFWMSYVEVLPAFKVRIFQDDPENGDSSIPVRTPSLMAGISYIGASSKWWNKVVAVDEHDNACTVSHYIGLTAYHHSNGQDGPELINNELNEYNGNFGEQVVFRFFLGGNFIANNSSMGNFYDINHRKENFKRLYKGRRSALNKEDIFYWRTGFEFHPWEQFGTNVVFKEHYLYGRHRIQLQGGYSLTPFFRDVYFNGTEWVPIDERKPERRTEVFRVIANVEYITDLKYNQGRNVLSLQRVGLFDFRKRFNADITAYYIFPGTTSASAFLRLGYVGSDNYNIYFQNSYFEARLGLAFAFFIQT